MTNERQIRDNVMSILGLSILLTTGIIWSVDNKNQKDIQRINERNTKIESTMSNLVERVNYYHGTNWNYQASVSTNDVRVGR